MAETKFAPQSSQGASSATGTPLPAPFLHQMQSSMGADFSGVRVHVGHNAVHVGARAYTQGQNIHFAPGEYQPGNDPGRELIAHELTHVIQQGAVGPKTLAPGLVRPLSKKACAERLPQKVENS